MNKARALRLVRLAGQSARLIQHETAHFAGTEKGVQYIL
jgi:peptide deformylase